MAEINFRCIEAPEIRRDEERDRVIKFVASDGSRDSAGTVLNPDGWDLRRFNRNGIIGYQHNVYGGEDFNPDNVIGKGHAYIYDHKLMVDVEFEPAELNPLADKIYRKLLFGSLKAVSVGFMPVGQGQWGKGEEALGGENQTYYYAGQELLEISVVNIPANPNALKKSIDEELERRAAEFVPEVEEAKEEQPEPVEAEVEPEPVEVEPEAAPEAEDTSRKEQTARELDLTATIARAALLSK